MTAKTIAHQRAQGITTLNELTALNVRKVTKYRKDGVEELERMIKKFELRGKQKTAEKEQKEEGEEEEEEEK